MTQAAARPRDIKGHIDVASEPLRALFQKGPLGQLPVWQTEDYKSYELKVREREKAALRGLRGPNGRGPVRSRAEADAERMEGTLARLLDPTGDLAQGLARVVREQIAAATTTTVTGAPTTANTTGPLSHEITTGPLSHEMASAAPAGVGGAEQTSPLRCSMPRNAIAMKLRGIEHIYNEYYHGLVGGPAGGRALVDLEREFGSAWRESNASEFSRRQEIARLVDEVAEQVRASSAHVDQRSAIRAAQIACQRALENKGIEYKRAQTTLAHLRDVGVTALADSASEVDGIRAKAWELVT